MYKVYFLKSEQYPKTYIGFTDNLERRLKEHNSGKHFYTKRYLPWKVVYCEECVSREKARECEKYYKSAAGRKKLKIILEEN